MKVLIADDEPLAREALRDAIGDRAEIVAECANGIEAAEAMRRLRLDVAFLDVEMPGLDGLAAVRDVDNPPAVVFVTAYDEYAVEAFALEAVDYILKPVEEGRVAEALRRVKARVQTRVSALQQRFIAGAYGKLIVIRVDDVRYFEAAENYVRLQTAAASPLMRGTLSNLEKRLDPRKFVRVHRSFIVNVALIAELTATKVILKDGGEVPLGRTFRDGVLHALQH